MKLEILDRLYEGSTAYSPAGELSIDVWLRACSVDGTAVPVAVSEHDDGSHDTWIISPQWLTNLSIGPVDYEPDVPDWVEEQFELAETNPEQVGIANAGDEQTGPSNTETEESP